MLLSTYTPKFNLTPPPNVAIHHAVTRQQRLAALQTARTAFAHKNTDLHSYEVDQGAIHALMLQLGYCLSSSSSSNTDHTALRYSDESMLLRMIGDCLHQILSQCATRRKIMIWQELGVTELVPLLLQLTTGDGIQHHYGWPVLRLFCKLPVAKSPLIRYPGLLQQVTSLLLQNQRQQREAAVSSSLPVLLGELLGALKDLSFRSESTDKEILWRTPGLNAQLVAIVMNALATTAETNGADGSAPNNRWNVRHKEYIATFWWNLALHDAVRDEMRSDAAVVPALQKLLLEPNVNIRQSAVAALGNLVSSPAKSAESLELLHQNETFWSTLQHLCLHEDDKDCRRRVVRTLRCLLAHTPKPATMYVLLQVAKNDVDTDTRLQALEGMRYLQDSLGEDCWTQALVSVIEGADARVTWVACQMFPAKARGLEPTNEFWTAIVQVVESIPESHGHIIGLLTSIAENTGHDKVLSSPIALTTLGKLVLTEKQATLDLLQQLAADDGKKRLAECDDVMSALVTLCLSTTGNDKDTAKGIILQLVPEL